MPLVPAKCPECGGNVVVDSEKEAWVCDFCKTPFIVGKAINHFNTVNNVTNNITNNNEIKADVVNVYENKISEFVVKAGRLIEYNGASMDVVIPDEVVSVGDVFRGSNVHSVMIHDMVTEVGQYAFEGCRRLERIQFPNEMRGILPSFSGCSSLKEISIPQGIEEIPAKAFLGCSSLKEIHIPDSVTTIGGGTFANCSQMESIYLPDTLESIGWDLRYGVFEGCTSLKEIHIPKTIDTIGERMFYDCNSLKNVCAPQIRCIKEAAFKNCTSLHNIPEFPMLETVGCYSSEYASIGAFEGCTELERIALGNNVKWNMNTFKGCKNLSIIEGSIKHIPPYFFAGCKKITAIDLDAVETISSTAFDADSVVMKKVNEQFVPPQSILNQNRHYPWETWSNKRVAMQQELDEKELAVEFFAKRMKLYLQKSRGESKKCPFCQKETIGWNGKCKNTNCISYRLTAIDVVDRMISKVREGKCPSCNAQLNVIKGKVYPDGKEHLEIECSSRNSLSCQLLFLHGWRDHEFH